MTMVSSRFEPVEIISIGHVDNSSTRAKYRFAAEGKARYEVNPVVSSIHPVHRS